MANFSFTNAFFSFKKFQNTPFLNTFYTIIRSFLRAISFSNYSIHFLKCMNNEKFESHILRLVNESAITISKQGDTSKN